MSRLHHSDRSGPSRKSCRLRFINRTERKVNVIWIDFDGAARNYGTLNPARVFDIFTYEGHPWISQDSVTLTRMLLNNSEVFYPSVTEDDEIPRNDFIHFLPMLSRNQQDNDEGNSERREIVLITLPVLPLKQLCAETVAKNVNNRQDIYRLPIPAVMKTYIISNLLPH